jgi:hypothetical protein
MAPGPKPATFRRFLTVLTLSALGACATPSTWQGTVERKAYFRAEQKPQLHLVRQQGISLHMTYFAQPQPVVRFVEEPECWGLLFEGTWHCAERSVWESVEAGQTVRFRTR